MHDVELNGYEIETGDPDIRGWEVIAGDGRRIGEVENLLVETENRQERFLRVRTDGQEDAGPHKEAPARTVGEALVRDSLLEIENQRTAGEHPGWSHNVLIPFAFFPFSISISHSRCRPHQKEGKRPLRSPQHGREEIQG